MSGVTDVPKLILASASPARRNLLVAAGIDATVQVSGVDESTVDSTSAQALCLTLARLKAEAVAARLNPAGEALVIGCDSVLDLDGKILGKPADPDDARHRWYAMRGRTGVLHTGHCVLHIGTGKRAEAVASTTVHFAEVTDEEIDAYVGTGEPLHVAGAFTLDGRSGPFIESIEGDHSNVIGLSLPLLRRLLAELGIRLTDLWTSR
ncbi:MAG: septum formation inhibitor Maf [Actinobacteria bacterium 13_1_20CM_3_71_11]|nr:MAG: septum formation inhibitor Maf [Actinobacteria bacterium 13_1_20CM_3_71_11]